jgi:hypothetical protein
MWNYILLILIIVIIIILAGLIFLDHYSKKEGDEWSTINRRTPENDYVEAIPINNSVYHSNNGDIYIVYPLCCEECKKCAIGQLNKYKEAMTNQLAVTKLKDWFITNKHPDNNLAEVNYDYLVLVLQGVTPFWNLQSLKTQQLQNLIKTIKYYWNSGRIVGDLGLCNIGSDGNLVIINLSSLKPRNDAENPFSAKGSVLTNIDPKLFSDLAAYDALKLYFKNFK